MVPAWERCGCPSHSSHPPIHRKKHIGLKVLLVSESHLGAQALTNLPNLRTSLNGQNLLFPYPSRGPLSISALIQPWEHHSPDDCCFVRPKACCPSVVLATYLEIDVTD